MLVIGRGQLTKALIEFALCHYYIAVVQKELPQLISHEMFFSNLELSSPHTVTPPSFYLRDLTKIFMQPHQVPFKLEVLVSGDKSRGGIEVSIVLLLRETFDVEDELR